MKAKKLVAVGLIATGVLSVVSGAVTSHAEEPSPETNSVKTEGKIELVEDGNDSGVVDPGGDGNEIIPPVVIPPIKAGEASLIWYPKLNFGTHKYNLSKGNKFDAVITKNDYFGMPKYDEKGNATGEVEKVPVATFAQVKHTPLAKSWELGVSLSEFIEKGSEGGVGKTLKGAKIQINGLNLKTNIGEKAELPKDGENAITSLELVPTSGTKKLMGYKAGETLSEKVSINSLILGEVSDSTEHDPSLVKEGSGEESKWVEDQTVKYNKGVTLELPSGLSVKQQGYTADLEWILSATF